MLLHSYVCRHMRALIALVVLLVGISVCGGNRLTLDFKEHTDNIEFEGMLALADASQVIVTIKSDSISAKYFQVFMVTSHNGEATTQSIGFMPVLGDSTRICFTAMSKDSATAIFSIAPKVCGRQIVSTPTSRHMLIGCDFKREYAETDTIPLVGYSTGIPKHFDLGNGEIIEGWDICSVRYSGVDPAMWGRHFGFSDYVYFEAVAVKDISYF